MSNHIETQTSNQEFIGLVPLTNASAASHNSNTISALSDACIIPNATAATAVLDDFSPEGLRAAIDLVKARLVQGLSTPEKEKAKTFVDYYTGGNLGKAAPSPTNYSPTVAVGKVNAGQVFHPLEEDRFGKGHRSSSTNASAVESITPAAVATERFSGFIRPNIYISSKALSSEERARVFAGTWSKPVRASRSASTNDVPTSQVGVQDVPARSTSDGAIGVTVFASQHSVFGGRERFGYGGNGQRPSATPIQPNAATGASTVHRNINVSSRLAPRLPLPPPYATPAPTSRDLAESKIPSTLGSAWLPASVLVLSPEETSSPTIFSPGPDLAGAVMAGAGVEEYLLDIVLPDDEASVPRCSPIDKAGRFPSLLDVVLPPIITGPPLLGEECRSHSLGPSIFDSPSIQDDDLVSCNVDGLMISLDVEEEAPPKAVRAVQVKNLARRYSSPPPTPPPSMPLPPLPNPKQAKRSSGGARIVRRGARVNTTPPKKHRKSAEEWLETAISGCQGYELERRVGGSEGVGYVRSRATRRTRAMRRHVSRRISTTFDFPKASGRRLDPIAEVDERAPVLDPTGRTASAVQRARIGRCRRSSGPAGMACQSSKRGKTAVYTAPVNASGGHVRSRKASLIPTRVTPPRTSNIFKRASKKILQLL